MLNTIWKNLKRFTLRALHIIAGIIWAILRRLGRFLHWLIYAGRRWQGARYSDPFETFAFLNPFHRGWLIAGRSRRMSERTSYQSLLTVGGMGSGKTSRFVIPNVLALDDRSMVITDTSGEIYDRCAGSLHRRGFLVKSLDLINLSQSLRYNPLAGLANITDIQQAAHLIIASSPANKNPNDPFWSLAAEKLLCLIIQAMHFAPNSQTPNLASLKYWLNQFDTQGGADKKLDELFAHASSKHPPLWHDYQALLNGNSKSLSSIKLTADISLAALSDPLFSKFTASHDFEFGELRQRKTALFIKVRELDLRHYSFLLNLYFAELFRVLLSERNPDHLPVCLLLDEFGHLTIPDFAVFATTARKYRVAFWIFLQSLSQLESRYGRDEAQTIMDGLATKIFLPGMNIETAEIISKTAGQNRRSSSEQALLYGELNMLNPDEVVHLGRSEALMLHANKRPFRLRLGTPRI